MLICALKVPLPLLLFLRLYSDLVAMHSTIRKILSSEHTKILVNTFVATKLDNCNSLLYGLPCDLLQLVHNCVARLILGGCKYDHMTPLLRELHWLPVEHRLILNYF